MRISTLLIRYISFAILATICNLATQRFVLAASPSHYGYILALIVGTTAGLGIKYLLDKRWIFYDGASSLNAHGKMFATYGLMGVFTTLIFWGSETTFWLIWQDDHIRELGAVIGLTLGYTLKYHLDKRFVFQKPRGREASP